MQSGLRADCVECSSRHSRMDVMKPVKERKPLYHAPALEKGLDILEVLADSSLPLSQVELAQRLGRSQGEFFRMLTCLTERGYVIREADSGRFKLTLRLYELGHKRHATSLLRSAARVPMEKLTEEISQACHLSVQSSYSALILMERMPSQRICLAVGEGSTFPLVETTSGKLLLTQLSAEDALMALEKDEAFAGKSPRERKTILHEIEEMRKSKCVVARSGMTDGVTDIATLVGVKATDTVAVLVVPYLAIGSQRKGSHKQYLTAILACAAEINRNLGVAG